MFQAKICLYSFLGLCLYLSHGTGLSQTTHLFLSSFAQGMDSFLNVLGHLYNKMAGFYYHR